MSNGQYVVLQMHGMGKEYLHKYFGEFNFHEMHTFHTCFISLYFDHEFQYYFQGAFTQRTPIMMLDSSLTLTGQVPELYQVNTKGQPCTKTTVSIICQSLNSTHYQKVNLFVKTGGLIVSFKIRRHSRNWIDAIIDSSKRNEHKVEKKTEFQHLLF